MESNLNEVVNRVVVRMESLRNPDKMLRSMALATLSNIHKRVHTDGKASDGSLIGTYSKSYLAVRSGNFQNASRVKRGAKKGQHKEAKKLGEAGTHIRGNNMGSSRPTYNRGTDPKVVLSLTRYMENDLSVIPLSSGGYGVGYKNPLNLEKAKWAEATYDKRIWALTSEEENDVRAVASSYVKKKLGNDR